MGTTETKTAETKVKETAFSKDAILTSTKYKNRRDLLKALLKDDETYTVTQVDKMINDFMKGKVK